MTDLVLLQGGKKSPAPPASLGIPYAVLRACPVRQDKLFLCDKGACPFDRRERQERDEERDRREAEAER